MNYHSALAAGCDGEATSSAVLDAKGSEVNLNGLVMATLW